MKVTGHAQSTVADSPLQLSNRAGTPSPS